ncbi:MAG: restriction endonuclease subunit S [Treponema sp.]|jgi:type I restriction enzyme S subunit|nr:restriction endonuclease subunit S [Treponema sp.]
MALSKYKLGELIRPVDERNTAGAITDFYGININKEFMPTVANTDGIDPTKYKIVRQGRFVFSGMQTGRDTCIRIGLYTEENPIIVSPAYITFETTNKDLILDEYLMMRFMSSEMDRYGWFLSDSSVRSNLDWDRFCDIELDLPKISIQKKYVNIYNALLQNQKVYERGLDDLNLTFDAYIEKLRRELPRIAIGEYIEESDERNSDLKLGKNEVKGMTITKEIIPTKANMNDASFEKYIVVQPGQFIYNPRTHGKKIGLGYNNTGACFLITWNNIAFFIKKECEDKLIPDYLFMFLKRAEWDRWACFNSWGSSTEVFAWEDLCRTEIPIPDTSIQRGVVNIFNAYSIRKDIIEKLKAQIKDICPILIRGAMEEGK